jgi:hypothetical protein
MGIFQRPTGSLSIKMAAHNYHYSFTLLPGILKFGTKSTTRGCVDLTNEIAKSTEKARERVSTNAGMMRQNSTSCRIGRSLSRRNASLWDRLSLSRIPHRYPVLYKLLSDTRNCFQRIQFLWTEGHTLPARTGLPYQQSARSGYLVLNKGCQVHSLGIQKLRSDSIWSMTENPRLFSVGWDKEEVFGAHSDNATSNVES